MAKPRILKVINYRQEDIPTLAHLEQILKREGKEFTEWAREQTRDYVKKHDKGNPAFKLENWAMDSGFVALPAMGELLSRDKLDKMEVIDIIDIHKNAKARMQETGAWLKNHGIYDI